MNDRTNVHNRKAPTKRTAANDSAKSAQDDARTTTPITSGGASMDSSTPMPRKPLPARSVLIALAATALVLIVMCTAYAASSHESSQTHSSDTATMRVNDAVSTASPTPARAEYASNVEVIYQNDIGLYSGCEIVSLAMTLKSMGIDIDPIDIAENYVEYLDSYYSSYGNGSSYYGYSDEYYNMYSLLESREETMAAMETTPDSPTEGSGDGADTGTGDEGTTPGSGSEEGGDSGGSGGSGSGSDSGGSGDSGTGSGTDTPSESTASTASHLTSTTATARLRTVSEEQDSVVNYYIGDPYWSGFGYPPTITKSANRILTAYSSFFTAKDSTKTSLQSLLSTVDNGYPVIVWATLDYTDPLVTWSSYGDDDWLWYNNLHCVVLCGHDSKANTVTIADPLQGYVELSVEEFDDVFTKCGNMSVTIS